MRVLFSTTAGTGHFGPLLPFAKTCAANGHTAAVAAPCRFAETAKSSGVPQVVLPLFSFDKGINADRVAAVNAGIQLNGGLDAITELPAALHRVFDDARFTDGARAIATEISALPDIAECLPILEELASERSNRDLGR
jgi:UDP:flavonoid glycosyltransferase YjiC (YdhE family)